jgi:hypothetical protein
MTEVEFSRLLSELAATAKVLNQKSDSLNDLIKALDEKLRQINLGLEVWVSADAIATEPTLKEDRDGEWYQNGEKRRELGFVKVDDTWCLAVREATYEYGTDNWGGRLTEFKAERDIVRLLECSREFRIAALKRFPELVDLMHTQAKEAIEVIEAAQKYVK